MLYLWNGEKENPKQTLRINLKWAVFAALLFLKRR